MPLFTKLGKYSSTALLLIRVGLGVMMVMHGYPKVIGGPDKWTALGNNMSNFGVTAYPEIWGFLGALSEGVGGLLLVLGLFFRPACFLLLCTMIVAATRHISAGETIMDASHAIELGVMFLGLFILGPGKYSIDKA